MTSPADARLALLFATATVIGCGESAPPPAATGAPPSTAVTAAPAEPPPSAKPAAPSAPAAAPPASSGDPHPPAHLTSRAIAIPDATPPLAFDYLAVDRGAGRVFLPVGNTGSLDVLDVANGTFTKVSGFSTREAEMKGKKRTLGPSSVTVGDGVVYVGNRATSEVCVVSIQGWKLGSCLKLPNSPDGIAYVPSVKELWATTPRENSLTVLDASKPAQLKAKTVVRLPGAPEGYAIDDPHGLFFTNLEDKGSTLAIDLKTHAVRSTWNPSCGSDGPRGIALDSARGLVFVACTDHVQVLDAAHDGAPLGKLDTGAGVDNLDYVESSGLLYAGAGKAATLTVAHFDDKGVPTVVASGATAAGARNAVADGKGTAYVPDPTASTLLVLDVATK